MEQKTNKTIVTEFYRNVVRLRKSELIADYVHEDYIQHSLMGKDGRDGLFAMVEFLKTLPPVDESEPSPIINIIAQDDQVVAHLDIHFMGKHVKVIELFRIQDGKAAEHWDVTEEQSGSNMPVIDITSAINNTGLSDKDFIRNIYSRFKDVHIHRIIAEDNYIAVHAELKRDKPIALFDIFKIQDKRITEHHYVKQDVPEQMMHDNGMF